MAAPRATVRLQFHAAFDFDAAARCVDYFALLGMSHVYASPVFAAVPGSTHGYDVIDNGVINAELGGEAGLRRLAHRLHRHGMGLIIDIVPNHMGIAGGYNRWWQDVLARGPASVHASSFDIDWERPDPTVHGKVLLPFLAQQYGTVLGKGEIVLRFDAVSGTIEAHHHDNRFPIAASSYGAILRRAGAPVLAPVIAAFEAPDGAANGTALLIQAGATAHGAHAIGTALAFYGADTDGGTADLHAVLEAQHYRLAWHRAGADDLNWRRFFEVTDLAGMRMEAPGLFDRTHGLVLRLYEEGLIDGVRVDHVDGLADPCGYCRRLRAALAARAPGRSGPAYIVVEKILAAGEQIPSDWQVDGTTGYDFMDQVGALLHAPEGAPELDRAWADVQPEACTFDETVQAARRQLLAHNLATEFQAACQALLALARCSLATRDYTANAIGRVLTELLVQFPVYRTYVDTVSATSAADSGCDAVTGALCRAPTDQAVFAGALRAAGLRLANADLALLAQLDLWLGGGQPDAAPDGATLAHQASAIRRFQQLTPPLVAKSVEDTAFYRYGRLLSRNQVGSDPGQFALSIADFHATCGARAARFPHALLATATHDHKRGEDVTARLAVLSEMPQAWRTCVQRWRAHNACHRQPAVAHRIAGQPDVMAPSAADEAMLYQTLAGVWPIGLRATDRAGIAALGERVAQWQRKAIREAKVYTDWGAPNVAYETACSDFLQAILQAPGATVFLAELVAWVTTITLPGIINSLTQTVLRLTTPGVPDLYQGTDWWDFSLVDPDNRRAVDMAGRQQMLEANRYTPYAALAWQNGAIKQRLIHAVLTLRATWPDLFAAGSYVPLVVTGAQAPNVVAFLRAHEAAVLVVIVPRLTAAALTGAVAPVIDPQYWGDTRVMLPDNVPLAWCNVLDQQAIAAPAQALDVAQVLATGPVGILVCQPALVPQDNAQY